jgi:hypothetical protein
MDTDSDTDTDSDSDADRDSDCVFPLTLTFDSSSEGFANFDPEDSLEPAPDHGFVYDDTEGAWSVSASMNEDEFADLRRTVNDDWTCATAVIADFSTVVGTDGGIQVYVLSGADYSWDDAWRDMPFGLTSAGTVELDLTEGSIDLADIKAIGVKVTAGTSETVTVVLDAITIE